MSRFRKINTDLLRRLRAQRGWSQKELATRAGYTDRLIRKAEQGGKLDVETIRDLAIALSLPQEAVTFDSLIEDNLSIAKKFVEGYDALGRDMLPIIESYITEDESYITEDFVFHVAGDPNSATFIGDWIGKEGYQKFLDVFFGIISREPNSLKPTYTLGEDTVVAKYVDTLHIPGQPNTILWIYLHFYFRDGLMCRVEDHYDTQAAVKTKLEF
jgi:transcriptional regulator with XRE-family HTH domain